MEESISNKIDLYKININSNPPTEEPSRQYYFMAKCRGWVKDFEEKNGRIPTACVTTFGCQMNARDSEKLLGILEAIGFSPTDSEQADFVIYNTCTVRDNANQRVYGRLGVLKRYKKANPRMKVALCGCIGVFMVANPIVASVVLVGLIVALFALKYGFIGSLVSISVLTVWQCVISRDSLSVILVCITIWLLVVVSHRSNIVRILQGKENTLDLFKKPKSPRGSDGAQGAQTDASQTQQADPVSDGDAAQTRDSENE